MPAMHLTHDWHLSLLYFVANHVSRSPNVVDSANDSIFCQAFVSFLSGSGGFTRRRVSLFSIRSATSNRNP